MIEIPNINLGLRSEAERPMGDLLRELLLGAGGEVINESGDYRLFKLEDEKQITSDWNETSACTNFAALNQIEIFLNAAYGIKTNWSDAYNAKTSRTVPGAGNWASASLTAPLNHGLLSEIEWPSDIDKGVGYFYRDITDKDLDNGRQWNEVWDYEWGWVARIDVASRQMLKEALKISPIGISIPSGSREIDGVWHTDKTEYGHRVALLHVYDDGRLEIQDHYPHIYTRTLASDFPVGWPTYVNLKKIMKQTVYAGNEYYYVNEDGSYVHIANAGTYNKGITDKLWEDWSRSEPATVDEIAQGGISGEISFLIGD